MWPYHPEARPGAYPPLPLYENGEVIERELGAAQQESLTTRYAEAAVGFIRRNRGGPFFLYLAPNQPHVPLFVSEKHKGKSGVGLYGDVIEEIDWAVGEVLGELKRCGLEKDTLVIFSSDNGPWLSYGEHAGSAGPLREGKGTVFEGGIRVPGIVSWPGHIPEASVSDVFHMTIDVLPTVAEVTGSPLPRGGDVDGKSVWPVWSGRPESYKPAEAYYLYYMKNELQGVVVWPWKLLFPHQSRTMGGETRATGGKPGKYKPVKFSEPLLFNLEKDPSESRDLYHEVETQHPEVLERLRALAVRARERMGDALQGSATGSASRPAGTVGAR
jgi:arylsulfatase